MRSCIIHNLPGWQVTSFGNGLGYELVNRDTGDNLFFQGDDAETFRDQLEGLTENGNGPVLEYADALACIWSDYFQGVE